MMRYLLFLFLTVTALAGCEPLPPGVAGGSLPVMMSGTPKTGEPEAVPPAPVGVAVAPPVTTPVQAPVTVVAAPPVVAAPEPPLLVQQRAACQREGGQMMPRGAGVYSCVLSTRDAGRSCTAASDCEGLCLARSGTCAPLQPLFGCQEVFTAPGRRETLCTD